MKIVGYSDFIGEQLYIKQQCLGAGEGEGNIPGSALLAFASDVQRIYAGI